MAKYIYTVVLCFATVSCNKLDKPLSASNATAPSSRDLNFSGTDFEPHEGHPLKVALIDRDLDARVFSSDTQIIGGKFSLTKEKALTDGHRYFLDYFADMNGNHSCDAPVTDHVWRIPIDTVSANITISDSHKMNFHDSCLSFKEPYTGPAGDTTLIITGRLLLGESVTDATGLRTGQALVGAHVFVEGYSDQDAVTDNTGAFRLAITLNKDQALTANDRRLVMWYTQPKAGKTSTDWDVADARFGAIKSIPLSGDLNVGDQRLNHTKAAKFKIVSAVDQSGISACWVRSNGLGANLVIWSGGEGNYTVDYLPPGSYDLAITCPGFQNNQVTISVGEASAKGSSEVVDDVTMTPAT